MNRYWPLEPGFVVTSPFGPRDGGFHWGTDFGYPGGSGGRAVYAIQSGTVLYSGAASGYGGPDPAGWLVVDSATEEGGGCVEYGHIVREVSQGAHVRAGQRIAHINPSRATNAGVAPHLHISVMPLGYEPDDKFDPIPWLHDAATVGTTPSGGAVMDQFAADVNILSPNDSGQRNMAGVSLIIVHTNEGPATGSVDGLLNYLANPAVEASYTMIVGGDGRIGRCNDDDYIPWAAGSPANEKGLHLCFLGRASQSRDEWLSRPAQLDAGARVMRDWHQRYGIPLTKLSGAQMRAGQRGCGGHMDTVDAWHATDHVDPGPGFPWDVVLARATGEQEDDMTPEQAQQLAEVHRELTQRYPSRSKYRTDDKPVDTMAGFVLNVDGRVHEASQDIPTQLAALAQALEELPAKIAAAIKDA